MAITISAHIKQQKGIRDTRVALNRSYQRIFVESGHGGGWRNHLNIKSIRDPR
jgi:hypothetical protein